MCDSMFVCIVCLWSSILKNYYCCRRDFDTERGFDRYECVIVTTGVSGTVQAPIAESAAAVLQRSFPNIFLSFITSGNHIRQPLLHHLTIMIVQN